MQDLKTFPSVIPGTHSPQLFYLKSIDLSVRVVIYDDDPLFIASDICAGLKLSNVTNALNRLDKEERTLISIKGASNLLPINAITESGLYKLILSSKKAETKQFKDWVTKEVLPSIRKAGRYELKPFGLSEYIGKQALQIITANLINLYDNVEQLEQRVKVLELNTNTKEMYYTISGFARLNGESITTEEAKRLGKYATTLSKAHGFNIGKQTHERWGYVNTYHSEILIQVFGY